MPTFNPSGDHVGSVLRLYPVSDYFLPLPCHLSGLSHHHFSCRVNRDMVRKGIKRWYITTQMYSLAVLDSSLKSRCQQGCIHSGGFRGKSVSVPFQLLEAAYYIPWLGVPPSHSLASVLTAPLIRALLFPSIGTVVITLGDEDCIIPSYWWLPPDLSFCLSVLPFQSVFITTAIVIFLKQKLDHFISLLTIVQSLPFSLHLKATVFTVACE